MREGVAYLLPHEKRLSYLYFGVEKSKQIISKIVFVCFYLKKLYLIF